MGSRELGIRHRGLCRPSRRSLSSVTAGFVLNRAAAACGQADEPSLLGSIDAAIIASAQSGDSATVRDTIKARLLAHSLLEGLCKLPESGGLRVLPGHVALPSANFHRDSDAARKRARWLLDQLEQDAAAGDVGVANGESVVGVEETNLKRRSLARASRKRARARQVQNPWIPQLSLGRGRFSRERASEERGVPRRWKS